jgi:hypothetical protein
MHMTSKRKPIPQMTKFGIANFPTPDDVAKQQKELLQKLKSSSIIPTLYEGIENCSLNDCGRHKCSDACRFGAYRKKCKSIPAIYWLLAEHDGPLYEVRVARMCWAQAFDDLHPPIVAAKKANQRALYNLYDPDVVAVGTFKVSVAADDYRCEIHQIVAGAAEHALKRAFVPSEKVEVAGFFWTKEVENLGPAISSVLRHGPRTWKNPRQRERTNETPNSAKATRWRTVSPAMFSADPAAPSNATNDCWPEYYAWRLSLMNDACMVRYGCDRYFNALHKPERERVIKVPKKHPFPRGLEYHMFGQGRWTHTDPQGMDYVPKRLRNQGGYTGDPNVDYFSLDDDE